MSRFKLVSALGLAAVVVATGLFVPNSAIGERNGKLPSVTWKLVPPEGGPEPRARGSVTVEAFRLPVYDDWGEIVGYGYSIHTEVYCKNLTTNWGPFPEGYYEFYRFDFTTGDFELYDWGNTPTGKLAVGGFDDQFVSDPRDLDLSELEFRPWEVRNLYGETVLKNY